MLNRPSKNLEWLRGVFAAEQPLLVYAACLAAGALCVGVALTSTGHNRSGGWTVLILALAAAAAERGAVRITPTVEVSVGLLPSLFAVAVFGPLAAMIVSASSMLGDVRRRHGVPLPYLRWVIYTSGRSISGAAAGFLAQLVSTSATNHVVSLAVGTAVGAAVLGILDIVFASAAATLRGANTAASIRMLVPMVFSSFPIFVPLVAVLTYAYTDISQWTLPLFLAPAFAAHRLSVLYQGQRRLAEDLVAANEHLERASLSFAAALVATLDARDRYTAGHSAAVAYYARDIAARMGLSAEDQKLAQLCGLVHDIGKIGLPVGLLEKSGPLTLAERRHMEEHPAIGERILANIDDYNEIAAIVRHHHERIDGRGYPDGLKRDGIPIISRIIAVADAYDAMTSDRPYRQAMPARIARFRIAQATESQFDTGVVAAFEAILAGGRYGTNDAIPLLEDAEHSIRSEFVLAAGAA